VRGLLEEAQQGQQGQRPADLRRQPLQPDGHGLRRRADAQDVEMIVVSRTPGWEGARRRPALSRCPAVAATDILVMRRFAYPRAEIASCLLRCCFASSLRSAVESYSPRC